MAAHVGLLLKDSICGDAKSNSEIKRCVVIDRDRHIEWWCVCEWRGKSRGANVASFDNSVRERREVFKKQINSCNQILEDKKDTARELQVCSLQKDETLLARLQKNDF